MTAEDSNSHGSRFDRAIAVFKNHGGILRTALALRSGIHPGTLYTMRDFGVLEMVSRGVYRLADSSPLGNPDLVTVATSVPGGVICLISALAFHEITTQIPHEVHVALPRAAEEPHLNHPPIKTYRFTGEAYTEGVEPHELDGVIARIYSPEKTLADCFKFRNKVGLDTAVEAVRFCRERKRVNVEDPMQICQNHQTIFSGRPPKFLTFYLRKNNVMLTRWENVSHLEKSMREGYVCLRTHKRYTIRESRLSEQNIRIL